MATAVSLAVTESRSMIRVKSSSRRLLRTSSKRFGATVFPDEADVALTGIHERHGVLREDYGGSLKSLGNPNQSVPLTIVQRHTR